MKKIFINIILTSLLCCPVLAKNNNTGIVIGDIVNIRSQPSLSGIIVTNVRIGELVTIINKTKKMIVIGKMKDYWYKIKTGPGKTGYIYGAFLFEKKALYSSAWNYHVTASYSGTLKLFWNRAFYAEFMAPGIKAKTVSGHYKIKGRRLFFDQKLPLIIQSSKTLYLYKYHGTHMLIDTLKNSDGNNPLWKHLKKTK